MPERGKKHRAAALAAQANAELMARNLARAKRLAQQAVDTWRDCADGWHLLGLVAFQEGRPADAVAQISRTLALTPDAAPAHANLAIALQALGREQEALRHFERAVALAPRAWTLHVLYARALLRAEQWSGAAQAYENAIGCGATGFDVWFAYAQALRRLGRVNDAQDELVRALNDKPDHPLGLAELGEVKLALRDFTGAIDILRRAESVSPQSEIVSNNLGLALKESGALADAEQAFQRTVALKPDLAEAWLNLGTVRLAQGRLDDALNDFARAEAIGTRVPESLFNMAKVAERKGDIAQANALYDRAIALQPSFADAHRNKGLNLLAAGDLQEGWREYAFRWDCADFIPLRRPFPQPRWDGRRDLSGTLLVWGEQGIGDELLYGTMTGDLAAGGLQVVREVDERLVPLLARSHPAVRFIARHAEPDPAIRAANIVAQIAVGDLGGYLRPAPTAFPATRCLKADASRVAAYRARLRADSADNMRLVGISWISRNAQIGAAKTTRLADWAPILKVPGVRLVDLQYGDTALERSEIAHDLGAAIHHLPDLDLRDDLDGVAALVAACDLVITVSNTTAHLGGGLGVPTWVLVPKGNARLWYWGQAGATTPWYSSVRLFRQGRVGDWSPVIADVAERLRLDVS